MSDLISRQAAIDAIRASTSKFTGFMEMEMYTDDNAVEAIKGLPSVQSEIIRCKDCRWHEQELPGMVFCPNTVGGWVEDNWFCKGGERKDDAV